MEEGCGRVLLLPLRWEVPSYLSYPDIPLFSDYGSRHAALSRRRSAVLPYLRPCRWRRGIVFGREGRFDHSDGMWALLSFCFRFCCSVVFWEEWTEIVIVDGPFSIQCVVSERTGQELEPTNQYSFPPSGLEGQTNSPGLNKGPFDLINKSPLGLPRTGSMSDYAVGDRIRFLPDLDGTVSVYVALGWIGTITWPAPCLHGMRFDSARTPPVVYPPLLPGTHRLSPSRL